MAAGLPGSRWREGGSQCRMASLQAAHEAAGGADVSPTGAKGLLTGPPSGEAKCSLLSLEGGALVVRD